MPVTETTLPSAEKLRAVIATLAESEEETREVFRAICAVTNEGAEARASYADVGALAGFVSNTRPIVETMQANLDGIEKATTADLTEIAGHGDRGMPSVPQYDEWGNPNY